jgi:DNA-binding LacI/PurR family transcriptional regulator
MSDAKPPTMADIASRAGVALSTVSYVLSGKRPVSDEIRERILAAIDELGYKPNGAARALASGATHTIALFLPSPSWDLVPVQQTFVAGATQATSDNGYGLLLSTQATDPQTIARLIETHRADGVILMETLAEDERVERLRSARLPMSLIGRTANNTGVNFVDLDFGAAVRTGLEYLAELGHECVALFNFPSEQLAAGYTSALVAEQAFAEHTEALGIQGIHVSCPYPAEDAFAVAAELLNSEPSCTAAITTAWQFSGLLAALRAASLHVPEDFSVVSVIASQYAEMLTPALTSIEWPAFEAGRLAAEMLIEHLTNSSAPVRQLLIGGELAVRESTGPPPATTRSRIRTPAKQKQVTRRRQVASSPSGEASQLAIAAPSTARAN